MGQDEEEGSHEGRQENDVRPRGRCEGEASEDCCESLPSCGAEKEYLSLSFEQLLITSAGSRCVGSYTVHVRSLRVSEPEFRTVAHHLCGVEVCGQLHCACSQFK